MKPHKTKGGQNHKTSSMTTRVKSQKASQNSCKSRVIEIFFYHLKLEYVKKK